MSEEEVMEGFLKRVGELKAKRPSRQEAEKAAETKRFEEPRVVPQANVLEGVHLPELAEVEALTTSIPEHICRPHKDFGDGSGICVTCGRTLFPTHMVVREFSTGANRDTSEGKFEYGGFLSPLVLQRFALFMHENRFLKNGKLRDSDNWKKGMPVRVYRESLLRHVIDLWLHLDGYPSMARDGVEEALCAIIFNAQGLLLEVLKEKLSEEP